MLCSVPFDSFNTKDIDTVDDGIEGLLFDYLPGHKRKDKNDNSNKNKNNNNNDSNNSNNNNNKKNNNNNKNNINNITSESSNNTTTADWSLLVAHFLGVDHIGHR